MSRENVDCFTALLHVFWKNLQTQPDAGIVNINSLLSMHEKAEPGRNMLFPPCVAFASEFTRITALADKKISSINVNLSFDSLEKDGNGYRLCQKAFAYLGIKDTIEFK